MRLKGTLLGAGIVGTVLALVVLWAYAWYAGHTEPPAVSSEPAVLKPLYRCDARAQCDQMKSCEEAMFFLQNCPRTQALDEDQDGIPCEVQWCQR